MEAVAYEKRWKGPNLNSLAMQQCRWCMITVYKRLKNVNKKQREELLRMLWEVSIAAGWVWKKSRERDVCSSAQILLGSRVVLKSMSYTLCSNGDRLDLHWELVCERINSYKPSLCMYICCILSIFSADQMYAITKSLTWPCFEASKS